MLHPRSSPRRIRRWLALIGLALALVALGLQLVKLAKPSVVPQDDFAAYWAAGRLNLTGGDPYRPDALLTPNPQAADVKGYGAVTPYWYPPWSLLLLMPFGLLDYPTARIVWLLLQLALVIFCADRLWRFYDGPPSQRGLAWVVALLLAPSIMLLGSGQISGLILLGVVGFLYAQRRERWWLAGAVLPLIAVKPQLLYLFWIALVIWVCDRRRWSVFVSAALVGVGATCFVLLFNHALIAQYLSVLTDYSLDIWLTPTLGAILRQLFGWDNFWLQFVPPLVGAIWCVFYYRRKRSTWDWGEQLPLLALVSCVSMAYGWLFDQVVLLPACVLVLAAIYRRPGHEGLRLFAIGYVALNLVALATIPLLQPLVMPTLRHPLEPAVRGAWHALAGTGPNRSWGVLFAPALFLLWWASKRMLSSTGGASAPVTGWGTGAGQD
jgi:hypothetical protein